MSDLTATRRPLPSAIACDLACLGFAGWTVLCNALVLFGGTTRQLVIAFVVALLALAAVVVYGVRKRRVGAWLRALDGPEVLEPEVAAPPPAAHEAGLRTRALFLALGTAAAVAFALRGDLGELWMIALAFFAASYAVVARAGRTGAPAAQPAGPAAEWALWLIGVGCAALTLCLQRANTDDGFYANIAVSVVDFPDQVLFAADNLHGIPGAALKVAVYSVTSIELLTGVVSRVLGVETLTIYHLVTPTLVALLTPLALGRLFRVLDGERFAWAVLAAVILLALDGGGGRGSFSDFAFSRLFQGKAMFATALLPALLAYGVRFALRPCALRLLMLAAVQIAALGTTVTAFWAAPLLATTGVLVGLAPRLRALPVLAKAVASSSYLLALGAYFKLLQPAAAEAAAEADVAAAAVSAAPQAPLALDASARLLDRAYAMVLGGGTHLWASLAIVLLTWPLCRTPLARRFAVVVPLAFFAVAGNPLLTDLLTKATTTTVYWRVLWLLPVPLFLALAASAVLRAGSSAFGVLRIAVFALVLTLFLQYASPQLAIIPGLLGAPAPKVHRGALVLARELIKHVPARSRVAATERVSGVLPMLNGYSYPLVIKPKYLPTPEADRSRRYKITRLLGKEATRSSQRKWVIANLDLYRIEGVVVRNRNPERGWDNGLKRAGFKRVARRHGLEVWTRRLPPPGPRSAP
jgi:hypothetical protein